MADNRLAVDERVAILAEIVRRKGEVGRTSLMKIAYLLQTVKEVPFEYDFQLYLYGPYSAEVLSDISMGVFWDVFQEHYYTTRDGYGYKITLSSGANNLLRDPQIADVVIKRHEDAINWAVQVFGNYTASEMEAIATLVWIDRELGDSQHTLSLDDLVAIAQEIKPRFPREQLEKIVKRLMQEGILNHVQPFHTV